MKILFDIGGTKMRIATSDDGQHINKPLILSTPQQFQEGYATLIENIKQLAQGHQIDVIAGGIAGPLDKDKEMLVKAPNLSDWKNKPLKAMLKDEFSCPVYLENDAALAGLGEVRFGEGKDKRIVAYLTISTGVGGVRIIDGKIENSERGFEPGHQIIQKNGFLCLGCKIHGHLEGHIGGAAIEKRFGRKAEEIDDQSVWDEIIDDLTIGLNNTVVHWSPDLIILGGSIMAKIDLEKVKKRLSELLVIYTESPPLVRASLGDMSGLYGALALVSPSTPSS